MDWVAPGAHAGSSAIRTLQRLAAEGADLYAPRLLREEVTNALLTGIRRRRWTGAQADVSFVRLQQLPVREVDTPGDLDRAYELARRYDDHPIYDMLYVAVSERLGIQFITADDNLRSRVPAMTWVTPPDKA